MKNSKPILLYFVCAALLTSCRIDDRLGRDRTVYEITEQNSEDITLPTISHELSQGEKSQDSPIKKEVMNPKASLNMPLADYPLTFFDTIAYDKERLAAKVKIELPQWVSTGDDTCAKMNKFYFDYYKKIRQYADDFLALHASDTNYNFVTTYYFDYSYDIFVSKNKRYLQVNILGFIDGRAHPSHVKEVLIWDVLTGELVTLDQMFTVDKEIYLPRLKEIAQKWIAESEYRKNYDIHDVMNNLNFFTFNSQSIDKENLLTFIFPEYSIGPYSDGTVYFSIPYSEISDILEFDIGSDDIQFQNYKDMFIYDSLNTAVKEYENQENASFDLPGNEHYNYYEGILENIPDGYYKNVATIMFEESTQSFRLYLFAVNASYDKALFLSYLDFDDIFNDAKSNITFEGDSIRIWTQFPFRASEINYIVRRKGENLEIIKAEYRDPSQETLDRQRELLDSKDIYGLIAFDDACIFYPYYYSDYVDLPKPILSFAHDEALKEYSKGRVSKAIEIMEYGLKLYTERHVLPNLDSDKGYKEGDFLKENPNLFTKNEFAGLLNDYGFFLYENKEYENALKFLLNVAVLSPERAVVYINLGDLYWDIGEQKNAVKNYNTYRELIHDDTKLPERVMQRVSSG